MLRTLLALLLIATPTSADVGPFPYTTGASLYVLFDDGSDTAVTMAEGTALKAGTYTAADAAIVTAGLASGTASNPNVYAGRIMIGSAASPSASDPVVGVVEEFYWGVGVEVDPAKETLTDTASTIPGVVAAIDSKLGTPVDSVSQDIAGVLTSANSAATQATTAATNTAAAAIRTALGLAAADVDAQLDAIATDASSAASASSSNPGLLQSTTIATLTSQTVGTLTAGSADDDAYNNCLAVITDASTTTQKAVVVIADYIGSTKQFRLAEAPDFTIAATDSIAILAQKLNRKTNDTVSDRYTWRFPRSGSATASNNQVKLPASSANIRTVAFDLDDVLEDGVTVDVASAAVSGSGATVIDTTIGEADRTVLIRLVDTSTAASYTVTLTFTASDSDSYTVTGTLVLE